MAHKSHLNELKRASGTVGPQLFGNRFDQIFYVEHLSHRME